MFMPERAAFCYINREKSGLRWMPLVSGLPKAKDILKNAGAQDIASAGEKAVSSHTVGSGAASEALRGVSDTDYRKI
jgi:hypothetical protein